jgi:glycosyltransferase involved in cell wall biosynthesis
MKVSFINYRYDSDLTADQYLEKYPAMNGWNKALIDLGIQVNVYNRFSEDKDFKNDGVNYHLVHDNINPDLKWYQNTKLFHEKIISETQEILHINSFRYAYQASLLKKKIPLAKIVVQHHAEKPGKLFKPFFLRNFSSSLDGFIFSSKEIYDEWLKVKAIASNKSFAEIMEGSSYFIIKNREEIRHKTGMIGSPVLLWVGRLNENKDPITVLSGFLKLLNDYPDAKLYMIYSEDNFKIKVLSFIEQSNLLKNNVELLGFVDHKNISDYYNSADYFVLGSHYEGSGFSLVEAMSCGVIPIVTDIPSFRMMTNNGEIGTLWKCGNADSFYYNAKNILMKPLKIESKKTLSYFSTNLSYSAIGNMAKKFYESLIGD